MSDFPPPSPVQSGALETPETTEIHQLGPDALWKPRVNPWIIAACVALAAFMEVLEVVADSLAIEMP